MSRGRREGSKEKEHTFRDICSCWDSNLEQNNSFPPGGIFLQKFFKCKYLLWNSFYHIKSINTQHNLSLFSIQITSRKNISNHARKAIRTSKISQNTPMNNTFFKINLRTRIKQLLHLFSTRNNISYLFSVTSPSVLKKTGELMSLFRNKSNA